MTLSVALRFLSWVVYLAVFCLVLRRAMRTPTRAHATIAAFFGATTVLIVLVSAGAVLGAQPPRWVSIASAVVAILLPYVLLRLLAGFTNVPGVVQRGAEAALVLCIIALVFAPESLAAATVLLLVTYFVVLAAYDTWGFAREAQSSRGVTRRRMQCVALGSVALAATVLTAALASADPARDELWTVIARLCALGSGLAYYLGFSPPTWLRRLWQAPALETFLGEVTELPYVPDTPTLLTRLEAHATAVLGAPTAAIGLWQETESVLRFWRGLGLRPTVAGYPEDMAEHGMAPREDVIDIRPQRLFSGRAFLRQRSVFSGDVLRDDPENRVFYAAWNVRAVLASPITSNKRRFGVLTIWSPREPVFAESDLELVDLVARQAAAVFESRALLDEVAEARARAEMDQLKDRFLASISHDLRNPLTAVGATAQLVRRRLDRAGNVEPDRLRASMAAIETSTRQMSSLVDQLLDYARLELGRPLELQLQAVDLVELTRSMVAAQSAASEQHALVFESREPALVGTWDRERLERVIQNLLNNAIKYSPEGGEIRVDLRTEHAQDGAWAALSVTDHGVGVPASDLEHIFSGFHRGSNVTGRIAGTGIGLATARQVVDQHGGALRVESVEHQGATFVVRLPLEPPPGTP